MRFCLFLSAFLAISALSARADIYDYSYVSYLGGDPTNYYLGTLEFQIDTSSQPDLYDAASFTYNQVNILQVGPSNGAGPSIQFTKYAFTLFGPYVENNDEFTVEQNYPDDVLPLFTGSTNNPVLATGTFKVDGSNSYCAYGNEDAGILTITDLDAVPTPEPSSAVLLGTGLLGAFGLAWRRVS